MGYNGLAACTLSEMAVSAVCIEKAVEFSLTILLLAAITVGLAMRINYERQLNLYVIISLLMILTLLFNAFYTLFDKKQLYRLENLFFDAYFPTLVYKFGAKLLEKMREEAVKARRVMDIVYCLYMVLVLADFVYINVENVQYCKQIPYLLVDSAGLTLSVWLVVFGYQHAQKQASSSQVMQQGASSTFVNPLPKMWKCIVVNILAQAIGVARTIYYQSEPGIHCKFTENQWGQEAIQFAFLITTYYMGMLATLLFFGEKKRSYAYWSTSTTRNSNQEQKVQLIEVSAFEKEQNQISFPATPPF